MILKFKTRYNKNGASWRLLDKIRKIDYTFLDEQTVIEKRTKDIGILYINNYPFKKINNIPATNLNKKVAEICIVYENGLGDIFYTDDMVYIMNDNGKTCDTINI